MGSRRLFRKIGVKPTFNFTICCLFLCSAGSGQVHGRTSVNTRSQRACLKNLQFIRHKPILLLYLYTNSETFEEKMIT